MPAGTTTLPSFPDTTATSVLPSGTTVAVTLPYLPLGPPRHTYCLRNFSISLWEMVWQIMFTSQFALTVLRLLFRFRIPPISELLHLQVLVSWTSRRWRMRLTVLFHCGSFCSTSCFILLGLNCLRRFSILFLIFILTFLSPSQTGFATTLGGFRSQSRHFVLGPGPAVKHATECVALTILGMAYSQSALTQPCLFALFALVEDFFLFIFFSTLSASERDQLLLCSLTPPLVIRRKQFACLEKRVSSIFQGLTVLASF